MGCSYRCGLELQGEGGSFAGSAAHVNGAVVRGHNRFHIIQPETKSLHVVPVTGRHTEELVKDEFLVFFFDTDAVVLDLDFVLRLPNNNMETRTFDHLVV